MTGRQLSAFINALASGQRPGGFSADPEDGEVLRMAIALRAARPDDFEPDEEFVAALYSELADRARSPLGPKAHALKVRRGRAALAAVAASVVLVAGTAAATEAFNRGTMAPVAVPVPHGQLLRTATFETADHQALGQIVAYRGHPSWVFMDVYGAGYDGRVICMLEGDNGAAVAVGTFDLHHGAAQFSRTVLVGFGRLRGATLLTPAGSIVASATFA